MIGTVDVKIRQVQAPETTWKHDMFAEDVVAPAPAYPAPGARVAAIETGTKLFISNLDYEVSTEDIKVDTFFVTSRFSFCVDSSFVLLSKHKKVVLLNGYMEVVALWFLLTLF